MSYGFEVIDQAEFCQSQFAGQQVGPENPATVGQLDDIPVHRRRKSNTGGARQIAAAFIGFVAGKGGPCGGKAHMIGDLVLADFTQAGGAVCVKPCACEPGVGAAHRSEEHTSELQSLMRISYAVFCLKKKKTNNTKSNKKQLRYIRKNKTIPTHK